MIKSFSEYNAFVAPSIGKSFHVLKKQINDKIAAEKLL